MAVIEETLAVDLEYIACEICGQEGRTLTAAHTDLLLGGNTTYFMHECHGCGTIYQYPRPTAATISKFYPPDYDQYTPSVQTGNWLRRIDRRYGLRKRGRVVTRHLKTGRLLDVGCATGDFLSEMKRQPGWTVVGIEPSRSASRYAYEHAGVEVINGLLNQAPFAPASFDAITLWDVLEHVYNPCLVIREAARLLRPGGILVINHPNLESIDRRLFGRFWLGYELPRHLYLFPTALLRRLMNDHQLQQVEQQCVYGSHAATCTSLTFMIGASLKNSVAKEVIRRLLFSKAARLLFLPYFKIIDQQGLGSNVTAVFKKV